MERSDIYLRNVEALDLYYHSWFLRGDHPELYSTGQYNCDKGYTAYPYNYYRVGKEKWNIYREDSQVAELYFRYHYDTKVKRKGLEVVSIHVDEWYVGLMQKLQTYMRSNIIAKNGIAIECNPTSNRLIGYFNRYDQHPILSFNTHNLEPDYQSAQINVSINTDDLGVFDTSISYEYALLLSAIRRKRHSEENMDDEAIYEYLEYIRKNSMEMAFKDQN